MEVNMLRRRKHANDGWNHRRLRNYEWERAMQALRNAALILVLGFMVLGFAFGNAWNQ
jgi:hypothetical protein